MIAAYRNAEGKLAQLDPGAPIEDALWIDLWRPLPAQVASVVALGIEVPTLSDMEEIEISNRLYREAGRDFMTVVLPGQLPGGEHVSAPVTFILDPHRLVTVRHHAPRPFETYPQRAGQSGPGCASPERVFLGLMDEIVGRLADHLEVAGKSLDEVARQTADRSAPQRAEMLEGALVRIGAEGERLARVRLALLTLERALGFYTVNRIETKPAEGKGSDSKSAEARASAALRPMVKALNRDIQALEVHADFLSSRVALTTDTTLGLINLSQNATVRIVSVVAVLFLPPTLIASIYGMNFAVMPELHRTWGYPVALILMIASAVGTWVYFKWRRWL